MRRRTRRSDALTTTNPYAELTERGFVVFEDVLREPLLSTLRTITDVLCSARPAAEVARRRSQGTMLSIMSDPAFADLIAWQPAIERLAAMGFEGATFTDGYIISKPPRSPRLFWHYDWFAWRDPGAFDVVPQQVFLMYYLTDTTPENGCLRVLPGSHRRHHPLRDRIGNPHDESLSRALDSDDPAFSTQPDEVDVPVRAGDLVIGDARTLARRSRQRKRRAAHCHHAVVSAGFRPSAGARSGADGQENAADAGRLASRDKGDGVGFESALRRQRAAVWSRPLRAPAITP